MDKITHRDLSTKLKLARVPKEAKTFKGVWASMKTDLRDGIAYLTLTQTHRTPPREPGCNCDPTQDCKHATEELDRAIRAMEKAGWELQTLLLIRQDTESAQLMRDDVLEEQYQILTEKKKRRKRLGDLKR